MTVPLIGAVGGISLNAATPATPANGAPGGGASGASQGVGALPGEELLHGSATAVEPGAAPSEALGAAGLESSSAGAGSGSFGNALTDAISSLEGSQRSASSAAQSLATGTVKDPESAVVTVEDAALSMQLAAQLRSKATEAVQTIFQTQV
jgi:flagellar hook-basal body complex protein FliE